MKKMTAFAVLMVLILSISCGALAEWYTPVHSIWFDIDDVQCVETTTLKYWDFGGLDGSNTGSDLPYKNPTMNPYRSDWDTKWRLYVYHTVTGGGEERYTNLFHAVQIQADMGIYGVLCGQKWVTPAMWIPIESNAIIADRHYSVAVRGNTKHYENYGATSIDLRVGIEANQ